MSNDGWRWRGWWAKRYGRRLAMAAPPMLGVKPFAYVTWRPTDPLIGVAWGRDEDDEWEISVGFGLAVVTVKFFEYCRPMEDE